MASLHEIRGREQEQRLVRPPMRRFPRRHIVKRHRLVEVISAFGPFPLGKIDGSEAIFDLAAQEASRISIEQRLEDYRRRIRFAEAGIGQSEKITGHEPKDGLAGSVFGKAREHRRRGIVKLLGKKLRRQPKPSPRRAAAAEDLANHRLVAGIVRQLADPERGPIRQWGFPLKRCHPSIAIKRPVPPSGALEAIRAQQRVLGIERFRALAREEKMRGPRLPVEKPLRPELRETAFIGLSRMGNRNAEEKQKKTNGNQAPRWPDCPLRSFLRGHIVGKVQFQ